MAKRAFEEWEKQSPEHCPAAAATVTTGPGDGALAGLLRNRLAAVASASGIGVVHGPFDSGPRWANDAFLAMSGYARDELGELGWSRLGAGGDWPSEAAATTREHDFVRKDGTPWPVIVSCDIDPSDATQLVMFAVDLTASRVAEAARRAANLRYARFFEVANIAFWTADAAGRVTLSSSATAERLHSETELFDVTDQAGLIHPDDRDFAVATWSAAIAASQSYDIEVRARGMDASEYRWTRLQAFPDIVDGVVTGWYGTSENIHERRLAADALVESEQRFNRLADDIPVIVWLCDAETMTTYLSKPWYDFTGMTDAASMGRGWMSAVLPEDRARHAPAARSMAAGSSFDLDFRLRAADGSYRWMLSSGRPRYDVSGTLIGYAGTLTDINARKVAERELAATQQRLSRALDGTGVGVWEWDAATEAVTVSGSTLIISGFDGGSDDNAIDYQAVIHPDDLPGLVAAMADYVEGRAEAFEIEVRVRHRDGGWVWVLDRGTATCRDAAGRATHMVGTMTNIDDSRRAAEQLRWTVEHDALTGLANRTLFHTRLDAALSGPQPRLALALLDIDDFKVVNDFLGHAAGDTLLGVLADRLRAFATPHETVARLGGDEFTLIIPDFGDRDQLMARLEQLSERLGAPFDYGGQSLTCRSSIGVALAPIHGTDASALLRNADIAMYSAKSTRRGAAALYEPALGARVRADAAAVATVRRALDAGRIEACYEPIARLSDRVIVGLEGWARISGGDGRVIDAHAIDGTFADSDLAVRLGDRLIDLVLADFGRWNDAGIAPEFMCANAAAGELRRKDYAPRLLARLAAHGIAPARLRVEIVETGLRDGRGADATEATLAALSRGGILCGLDSFGTGGASLAHLTRLPLAAIKIDRQFMRGVVAPGSDQTIVRAITGLGVSFGLRVVGVGVETAAQAAMLTEIGCTYGQGPYFGLPRDPVATEAALRD